MPSIWDAPPAIQTEPPARRRRSDGFDLLADMGGGAVASLPPVDEDPFGFLPPAPRTPRPPAPMKPEPAAPAPQLEVEPDGPGFLGTIGDVLDRPGNAVRGLLRGNLGGLKGLVPFGETLGIYNPETDRTSGRDLLRAVGIENSDEDGLLSAGGLAGLGVELATDPLNLLPGMLGIKAATKAGKAARVVGSHLDDASRAVKAAKFGERGLKQAIEAGEQAGKVWDEASIQAAREALPKAKTDLLGDLLTEGGQQVSDADLVARLTGRSDEVGKAAKELAESGAKEFRPLADAGERVRAGQEALLSVGGEWDPFGLFRLGGKYNPINALPKVPGLTAPLELPQKTLIEGAGGAQALQDVWRGLGELPGIKQAKAIFSEVPGAPLASQEALQQFAKESRQDVRAGGAAAEEGARTLDQQIKGMGNVDVAPRPADLLKEAEIDPSEWPEGIVSGPNGEPVDAVTGEFLQGIEKPIPSPLKETPLDAKAQAILDEDANPTKLPFGWEVTRFPDLPASAPKKPFVEGARVTPLEDVTGRPQFEDFEIPQKGHTVRFSPRAALSNAAGLKKPITAKIEQIFEFQGQTVAQLEGGWTVPLSAVKRPSANVRKNFQDALDMYERERQWKGKTPTEIKRLKEMARDARSALEQATDTGQLIGLERNAALKADRNDILAELGLKESGDLEQAKALPKILERALQKGATPQLKTIDYLNAESGAVGVGDVLKIGGDKFTFKGIDPETGLVRLQDGIPIDVPMDRIPVDKGAPIERAVGDAELSQRAEGFDILEDLAGGPKLPERTADTMSEAIALSSPNGQMSKRARDAANERLRVKLFGEEGLQVQLPKQPSEVERLQRQAKELRELAARGMSVQKFTKQAEKLEAQAAELMAGGASGKEALQVPPTAPRDLSKLNKAVDVLADTEAKLGLKPFNRDVPDILPEPETVADLGRSEVPDILEDLMKPQPPASVGASSIGEASNPAYMREFADRSSEAAGRAVDAREATRQGIIDSGGASEAAVDRFRAQDNAVRQAENTAKAAEKLADAGENLQAANTQAREMMQGKSVAAGKAITEALERPGAMVTPQDVTETVDKIRARYDEIIKLERDITPELVDARVKYVTHVPTEAGRSFFRRMGKDRGSQAALFVELEKKRIAAGLPGDVGAAAAEATARGSDLPTDPAFRAEVQQNRAVAKRQGSGKSKPVPANVMREWETAALKMEPDARKFIEENGLMQEYLAFGRDFALEHGSQIPRLKQYKGLTVNELNDVMGSFAQRMGIKGEVYNSNPAAQLFTREMRHAKVMAGKSFLEKTAEQFGKPDANVGEVMKNLEDLSPEGFRKMMGIEDPQTAAAAFDTLKRLTDEEEVGQLLGWFDKITRGWKGWITRGFPAYHVRNHISNRFQGWLGGVPLAGDHIELGHKLTAGTDFKFTAGDGKLLDRDGLLKEMQQTGTLKGGFFEQNLSEQLDETASQWDFFNPNNKFITGAERVSAGLAGGGAQILAGGAKNLTKMDGNAIEAADRASVYIHFRKQGFSPRAAAQKVDELLFDYSKENLSPFEQKYLNRAVFFYGYTRNVLPFVARAMGENGAKVAQLLKLGTQPGRPDFVPEYAAGGLNVPLSTNKDGERRMAYNLGTPIESASELFAQNPLTSLNPLLKVPLELATGQDFFLGKSIEDAKKAPNWVDNSPDVLQDLLGTVKTTKKNGGQRVEIDPNIAYALRNNPLSRIGTTASKAFDERVEPLDILQSLLSGARLVSIDEEQEEAWRRKDKARDILRDLAREGKAKVGKYESFGRGEGIERGEDPMLDMLLRAAAGK